MSKKNTTIEINGKRYDANTGVALSKDAKTVPPKPKTTMHDVVRHPAKHAAPHNPKTAHTLMRQSVKKPGPSPKITKSHLITHFTPIPMAMARQFPTTVPARPAVPPVIAHRPAKKAPKTTADVLELVLQNSTGHHEPVKKTKRSPAKRRAVVAGAVVVLAIGVIGSQQLPNLRLQMASAKAGFSASLPEYQPAGFSLGKVNYSSGVVAARFASNSDERSYTITQKQSSWDSAALRDTFVAPTDKKFQAVESAGRTIYLYAGGSATWVAGGVWYVIQGNGSLSNRQLVQLATSL